ncbi:hypothetical protein, partial [Desulfococcus sp.]|uniref:hypothetical protein n=1 Tax=Desulfococcus sp. TaxID=2025834 RepID=UPI003D13735D
KNWNKNQAISQMKDRNHNREPETAAEDASGFRYACTRAGPSLGFIRASTPDGLPAGHTSK